MTCGNAVRTMQHETDQELVLFRNGEVMALMAVQGLVLALRPAVISRLHQVAAHAELGIILSEVIKLIRDKTTTTDDDEQQRCDNQFCPQGNWLLETLGKLRDRFFKEIAQFYVPPYVCRCAESKIVA
jgi:hypothetical protein